MRIISLSRFLAEALRQARDGRLSLLAGAGVSMVPPTCLASAMQLKRLAVSSLCDTPGLRLYRRKVMLSPRFDSLVLEILFQRFYESFGSRLFSFFDVLADAEPNLVHTVVAELQQKFAIPVVTTNFDTLVERQQESPRPVLHLHGELGDREQMVVRINQVGKGLPTGLVRNAGRCIRGRVLLVLGYSGSDEDVRVLLRRCRPARVLWLVRVRGDLALQNIQRSFKGFDVAVAFGDLGLVSRRIAARVRVESALTRLGMRRGGGKMHFSWGRRLTLDERYMALSEVMMDIESYRLAAEVALAGYRRCRVLERRARFLIQAAGAYKVLADTPAAIGWAKKGLALARKSRDSWAIAAALNTHGLALLEQHETDPARALPLFRRAGAAISSALRERRSPEVRERMRGFAARVFNNLGLALMQLRRDAKAEQAFMGSLAFKRQSGDIIGMATTAANLARLKYRRREHGPAHKWKWRCLYLVERYDRKFTKAYLLRSLGGIACEQGRTKVGMRSLKAALGIYQDLLGDGLGVRLTKEIMARFRKRGGTR